MRLESLTRRSDEAAQMRAYQTDPNVGAWRIEQVRGWSAGLIWAGVILGLLFTMTNVQQFAANGAPAGSLTWLSAWLLDPMVSLVLIGVLVAEQVTSRWQVDTPRWATATKWFSLAATYVMNTWQSWFAFSAAGIVRHSVPPLLVFVAVEGGPAMREALTRAVACSLTGPPADTTGPAVTAPAVTGSASLSMNRRGDTHEPDQATVHEPVHERVPEPVQESVHACVHEPVAEPVRESRPRRSVKGRTSTRATTAKGGKRVLFADYLAMARDRRTPDAEKVTPAWCKAVTGCSDGTSVKLAAALNTEPPREPVASPAPVDPATAATGDTLVHPVPHPVPDTTSTTIPADSEGEAA